MLFLRIGSAHRRARRPLEFSRGHLAFGVVGLLMGAMLAGVFAWNWNAAPRQTVTRFEIALPESVRLTVGRGHAVTLSPDGTQLVYSANQQLYLRSMDYMGTTPIRGTEGGGERFPFFSPDGEWIGLLVGRQAAEGSHHWWGAGGHCVRPRIPMERAGAPTATFCLDGVPEASSGFPPRGESGSS